MEKRFRSRDGGFASSRHGLQGHREAGGEVVRPETISSLADAGTQETSVILYPYLAAGQKIRNRCDHFSAAFGA